MFTNKLATAVAEAKTLDDIDKLSRLIWSSHTAGLIEDGSAQGFAEVLEAKKRSIGIRRSQKSIGSPGAVSGHPRRTPTAKLVRRRKWMASGQIPAAIACHYTPGQQSVLCVIICLLRQGQYVTKTLQEIGDLAGVCRKTVQRTLVTAKQMGHLKVIERRVSVTKNLPHKISAADPLLVKWIAFKPVSRTFEFNLKKQIFKQPYPNFKPTGAEKKSGNIFKVAKKSDVFLLNKPRD